MASEVKLQAVLSLKDKMSGGLRQSQVSIKQLTKFAKLAGIAVLGIGAAFVGSSIKSAGKFDKAIRNIGTLLGSTAENEMPKFKKGIIELMKTLPVDPDDLGASAYNIVSAGISDTAEAMEVLKSSAELGIAGLSTTEEAVNILTSAMNVYGDETHDSTRLADILFKTVKNGKTTIAGLSQGFGKVAGIAKETGISIEDLSAATAALTTTGITASEAQTSLKAVISNLLKPTADAEAAADKLGIKFNLAALEADGLSGLLANVTDAAGDDKQALADLFGSVEAANAIFSLTSEGGGEQFRKILEDITDETNAMGEAVDVQTSGMEAQIQLLKGNFEAIKIELGEKLIPVIVNATAFLVENSDKIQAVIDDVLAFSKVVVDAIAFVFNAVKQPLEDVLTFILIAKDKIETGFGSITDFVGGVVEDVGGFIEDVSEAVVKGITTDEEAITEMTDKMVEDTKAGFVEYEKNAFSTFDGFIGGLSDMYSVMGSQSTVAWNTLLELISNTWSNAGRIIGLTFGSIVVVANKSINIIGGLLMTVATGVAVGFDIMVKTVSGAIGGLVPWVGQQMAILGVGIAEGFRIYVDTITGILSGIPAFFTMVWDSAKLTFLEFGDEFTGWAESTADTVLDFFLAIPNAIIGAFEGVKGFFGDIEGGIKEAINFGGPQAEGGPVSGGTPYVVGEKGPELFVPRGSGNIVPNDQVGGSTINVDLRGAVVRDEQDLDSIINAVKQSLDRDLSVQQMGI